MITKNWMEIRRAAEAGSKLLFPLGVIEEHGPHLPLGSDIFWSQRMCEMVREELKRNGQDALIVPAYYWGINYCTGAFPGSFSLKEETMKQVLEELFENLKGFGFEEVYCFNYHGDTKHIRVIVEAIQVAREKLSMNVKLVLEGMDLRLHGWQGDEEFLLVYNPAYPLEWFDEQEPSEVGRLDIHAGAFETAVMSHFVPELVDLEKAKTLQSTSLDESGMKSWLQGGENTRKQVPLGYAGNPAGYEAVEKHVEEMLALQVEAIVEGMLQISLKQDIPDVLKQIITETLG